MKVEVVALSLVTAQRLGGNEITRPNLYGISDYVAVSKPK